MLKGIVMDEKDLQALKDEVADLKNKLRDSTRPWRHDRWESIKNDPQAAFVMFVVGAILGQLFGGVLLSFIGF